MHDLDKKETIFEKLGDKDHPKRLDVKRLCLKVVKQASLERIICVWASLMIDFVYIRGIRDHR